MEHNMNYLSSLKLFLGQLSIVLAKSNTFRNKYIMACFAMICQVCYYMYLQSREIGASSELDC